MEALSGNAPSGKAAVFLQQGNHVSDALGVGSAGLKLVSDLDEIARSLALSSDKLEF